jgi:hypothetical protein
MYYKRSSQNVLFQSILENDIDAKENDWGFDEVDEWGLEYDEWGIK